METQNKYARRTMIMRDIKRVRAFLDDPKIRFFHPANASQAGIFSAGKDGAVLQGKISVQVLDHLVQGGTISVVRKTINGCLYRPALRKKRAKSSDARPLTAKERRNAVWESAERLFSSPEGGDPAIGPVAVADSPVGWLARRRDSKGHPFLTRDEVAAAERLRNDFENSQLAPGVTQDWKRFLTSGVQGGTRVSAQERDFDNSAGAARERLSDALKFLGPGLSDVALRVCCFLEGIEAIESSMHWSRRSGKVVLKISLQRLAVFYRDLSIRSSAAIESWHAETEVAAESSAE